MTLHPIKLDPPDRKALIRQTKTLAANDVRRETGEVSEGPETAALLAGCILSGALRQLANGADAYELERGLQMAHHIVVDVLRRLSRPEPEAGVVPGSGYVFMRALAVLETEEPHFVEDVRAGVHLLRFALEEPVRELAVRLGLPPDEVVAQMREGRGAMGLDPATGAFVDLLEAGVTVSTPVVHAVLDASVNSVAALLRVLGARAAKTEPLNEPEGRMRPWP